MSERDISANFHYFMTLLICVSDFFSIKYIRFNIQISSAVLLNIWLIPTLAHTHTYDTYICNMCTNADAIIHPYAYL